MTLWGLWLIVGVSLLIIELFTQAVWTMCAAVGCIAALGVSLLGVSIVWQLVALAVFTVVSFFILSPFIKGMYTHTSDKRRREIATGMDALIGRKAFVTQEIRPGKPGRIRIDGDNWQAILSQDSEELHRGEPVVVIGHDSIILIVKKLKEI